MGVQNNWRTLIIIGAQWGDEGKGKITDFFTKKVDYVVRFQGGNNAGHTLVVDGKTYKLHHIPSGILYPEKKIVLGNGMVINPEIFLEELDNLKEKGIEPQILISERAHVIFSFHTLIDGLIDSSKGKLAAGVTNRGIGPTYADKAYRSGIRMVDFINPNIFKDKFNFLFDKTYKVLKNIYNFDEDLNKEDLYNKYLKIADRIRPLVKDTSLEINLAIDNDKKVLFEGAQGILLDIDHGIYPHNTSSNVVAGAVCTGAGVSPKKIDKILGVVKAYLSRVGVSPLPSEDLSEKGNYLRERGAEYGTTTGRPRRCGWIDFVQLRYANRLNGFTSLAITKIDILGGLKKIPVCVNYKIGNEIISELPADMEKFEKCEPVWEMMPGWEDLNKEQLAEIVLKGYDSLPENMKKYINKIEDELKVPVEIVSVGPGREETIIRI